MTIKHKVQRNLDPTFQAELNLASYVVRQHGGSEWSVQGLGMGSGVDYQVHICVVDAPAGSEPGWASAPLASSGQRCAAPSDLALMGGMWVGTLGSVALGLSILLPSLHGPPQKSPQVPDLRRFSQNPAFTLHAPELLLVLFFFISDCCAQDCESEKPPRSRFRCKHM